MSITESNNGLEQEVLQIVTFKIANEEFGFDIFKVKEINKMLEITQIPNSYNSIQGVINLRGSVIPIVNLREKLNFPEKEHTSDTRIIVVEYQSKSLGFIVDEVSEVLRINSSTIEQVPKMTTNVETAYISGVAKLDNKLLILLDLDKILIQEDMELEIV